MRTIALKDRFSLWFNDVKRECEALQKDLERLAFLQRYEHLKRQKKREAF